MCQCVKYFNDPNSNVYVASLDASKAFDGVNHFKLFTTLVQTGLPKSVVDIIINWYSKLSATVRWNGQNSTSSFPVLSGVRQGGILSPILFNVYINCMITNLRKLDYGCHVHNIFIGCIIYADDLLLLSASVAVLQLMLNTCGDIGSILGINFNAMKSSCIIFGSSKCMTPEPMNISNCRIEWVDRIKYLGVTLTAGKKV